MATDYDAPRKNDDDVNEDSIEELKSRRTDKSSGSVDVDETDRAIEASQRAGESWRRVTPADRSRLLRRFAARPGPLGMRLADGVVAPLLQVLVLTFRLPLGGLDGFGQRGFASGQGLQEGGQQGS